VHAAALRWQVPNSLRPLHFGHRAGALIISRNQTKARPRRFPASSRVDVNGGRHRRGAPTTSEMATPRQAKPVIGSNPAVLCRAGRFANGRCMPRPRPPMRLLRRVRSRIWDARRALLETHWQPTTETCCVAPAEDGTMTVLSFQ
jgi:hypothetical protein